MDVQVVKKANFWPSPQDYNEAVQNPHVNVNDEELKAGRAATTALGLPRPITGAFASVYEWHCPDKKLALRCFLKDIPDNQWRYGRIADYLQKVASPYTVGFDFQFKGVQVGGRWFPILKMDWVNGLTLDNYVAERIVAGGLEPEFAESFKAMCANLEGLGIAHGDLQHGNIMVSDRRLLLVDYDGMFVPHLQTPHSNELGHRNYQHPGRTALHFGAYLDNFSAWNIYLSLKALSLDPSLYERLGAGDDCLLFRSEDFKSPLRSCAFAALETHGHKELRFLARYIRSLLDLPPDKVPSVTQPPDNAQELPSVDADAPLDRRAMTLEQMTLHASAVRSSVPVAIVSTADRQNVSGAGQSPLHSPLEPALIHRVPRRVRYNNKCLRLNPLFLQFMALIVSAFSMYLLFDVYTVRFLIEPVVARTVFCLLTLILCAVICARPFYDLYVVRYGTAVRGRVIDRTVRHKVKVEDVGYGLITHDQHACFVTIEYPRIISGRTVSVRSEVRVTDDQLRALADNEEISVVYLPQTGPVIYRFSYFQAS
jgi:hypothetical protein